VIHNCFKGAGFLASPERIEFKDFEVGQTYSIKVNRLHLCEQSNFCKIMLTNVSFSFNSFKIITLSPKIKDFFKVEYTLPGRMSAGTACSIKGNNNCSCCYLFLHTSVSFSPKVNEDILDVLPLLSETGSLEIPIICETKKVVVIEATIDPIIV
jgi:hypothetical protein